jgi:hypothetical protein
VRRPRARGLLPAPAGRPGRAGSGRAPRHVGQRPRQRSSAAAPSPTAVTSMPRRSARAAAWSAWWGRLRPRSSFMGGTITSGTATACFMGRRTALVWVFSLSCGQPFDSLRRASSRRFANPRRQAMRRDTFLKSLAALAAAGTLPLSAQPAPTKMMIPPTPAAAGTPPAAPWARRCRTRGRTSVTTTTRAAPPAPSAWRSSSTPARATRTP